MTLIRYAADQDARRSGFVKDLYLEAVPGAVAFHEWLGLNAPRPSAKQSASGPQIHLVHSISVAKGFIEGECGYNVLRQVTIAERQELVKKLRTDPPFLWGNDKKVSVSESWRAFHLKTNYSSDGRKSAT